MGKKELNFPSGKTADSFTTARNSTRRILRQNRIETHQSATPLINQSEPHVSAITVQSEDVRASPDGYKNPRRPQFDITAISEKDEDTSYFDFIDVEFCIYNRLFSEPPFNFIKFGIGDDAN